MLKLWAPWRIDYLTGEKPEGCVFCDLPKENNDRENLILYRDAEIFVIMNRYPYTNGHLLIVPYRHTSEFGDLSSSELAVCMKLLQTSQKHLLATMRPEGFNIGLNLGKVAGAGIHEHLHFHIVPRWGGDTNFMPVFSDARVISQHLLETYDQLRPHFQGHGPVEEA